MTTEANFEKETIKVFRTPDAGKRGTEIAVIRWIKDGKAYAPQLANQEIYYQRTDGQNIQKRYGKMKGLKLDDLDIIQKNLKEITALMKEEPEALKRAHEEANPAPAAEESLPWD